MSPVEEPLERRAIISGIGQSDVGRRLGRSDLDLTVEAGLAAIADAGLTRDDIDGLTTPPRHGGGGLSCFAGPTFAWRSKTSMGLVAELARRRRARARR